MSGWDYEDVGKFGSRQQAEDWARRNDIAPQDLHLKDEGGGKVDAAVKRSASSDRYKDRDNDRRDGFFD